MALVTIEFDNHDSWADEYQIKAALHKALESKEAPDFIDELTEVAPPEVPREGRMSLVFGS